MSEPARLRTADGLELEAEVAEAGEARAGAVLCHPHPLYGGDMRSVVTGDLFAALPDHGITCLRFNFRGVGGSEGHPGRGGEDLDALAAVDALAGRLPLAPGLVLVGYSFGADVARRVSDPRLAGWVLIAPPFAAPQESAVAGDTRPKLVLLGEHDEFRSPADVLSRTAGWAATTVEVIPGASHFLVGRLDRVVEATARFVSEPGAAAG